MIRNSSEKELQTKQEAGIIDESASSSSRLWSGLRNPRIVRVSRAFGGKDRHSKVSTVRGLRDRRVRLSVPTAIQLYDLQDRLGLNQPSKVVDWLLNAAQHEIDKLPPLQIPPGNFIHFAQPLAIPSDRSPSESPPNPQLEYANYEHGAARPLSLLSRRSSSENMSNAISGEDLATMPKSTYWQSDAPQRTRQLGNEVGNDRESLVRMNHSSASEILISNLMPHTSYYQWEPSTNSFASHMGGAHSSQLEAAPSSIPPSFFQASGSQLVLYPSRAAAPSMFQPYTTNASTDHHFDARQFDHPSPGSSQNLPSNPTRGYRLSGSSGVARSFHPNLDSMHQNSQDHHES